MKKILIACVISMLMLPSTVLADPYLISPYNGQTISNDQPLFDWGDTDMGYIDYWFLEIGRSPYTDYDDFFYSSDSVYANNRIRLSYLSFLFEYRYLTPGTYYWQVLGMYRSGSPAWSQIWSFTVPAPYVPPAPPAYTPPPPRPAPAPVAVRDTYRPRTYAKKARAAKRKGRRKIATAKLRWKVRDNTSTVYVKLKIQKRVKSKLRVKRKARYLKRYKAYKGKYLSYKKQKSKTKNRTLARRYHRAAVKYKKAMNKYLRAYRKTKTVVYKTVKTPNYRWTRVNKWRTYKWRTRSKGVYRYLVYAKDKAKNSQRNVAKAGFRIK